jgi:hypothetical protein
VRQRIADHDVGQRGDQGNAHGVAKHPEIDRRLDQAFVVLEREASPFFPKGEAQHVDDGRVEGDEHQHQKRCDEAKALSAHRPKGSA